MFLTAQTLAQAILAALLPVTLMPGHGANGGLAALAILSVAASGFSLWIPYSLPALHSAGPGSGGVPRVAFLGLASVFLWMAGIVGLWVFMEQLGTGPLIGARIAGFAIAAALAAQVTGSGAATLLSGRLPTVAVLSLACLINVGVTRVLSGTIGPPAYLGSVLVFGFLWMFALPFQTRLMIQLDTSRRAAMLLPAAQLLGSATGPMITSSFANDGNLAGALNAGAALFGAGTVCLMAISLLGDRKKAVLF